MTKTRITVNRNRIGIQAGAATPSLRRFRRKRNPTTTLRTIKRRINTTAVRGRAMGSNFRALARRAPTRINRASTRVKRAEILPYLDCRFNPLGMKGGDSPGIVDGSQTRRIVVDHRFIIPFTAGTSQGFNIAITPCLPSCVWFNTLAADTASIVNGITMTAHTGVNPGNQFYGTVSLPEYSGIFPVFTTTPGDYAFVNPYLGSGKARIVTIGGRIIFTGSTMNNNGFIIINNDSMNTMNMIPNTNAGSLIGDQGTDTTLTPNTVQFLPTDYAPNFNIVNQGGDGFSGRLSEGAHFLAKHSDEKYTFKAMFQNPVALVASNNYNEEAGFLLTKNGGAGNLDTYSMLQFVDNDWDVISIQVNGMAQGQSFNLDLVYCVEYAPATSSAVTHLAKVPAAQPSTMSAANLVAPMVPVASRNDAPYKQAAQESSNIAAHSNLTKMLFEGVTTLGTGLMKLAS
jgi:hypothetical protein